MAAGLISGLAGVLYAGTTGAADPSSGSQLLLPAYAAAFLGASIELTAYQLLHQQGWDGARLAAAARSAGLDRVVLSSDAGQPDSPPPPEALLRLVAALTAAGLDPRAVEAMASELPQALVEPD